MNRLFNWLLSKNSIAKTSNPISLALLLLRVSPALMMAFGHGLGKLTGFSEKSATFADPLGVGSATSLGLAVFAEFFCSLALALGLVTRGVLIPLIINMSVAGFIIHSADPFAKKELALLFLTIFLTLFITGPGKYSFDNLFSKK